MARPNKRSALATLSRARLAELATGFEVDVRSSASKSEILDAVAHSKRAAFERVLELLLREELKEICRAHGLDDSGKTKQPIIERILGKEATPQLPGVIDDEPADETATYSTPPADATASAAQDATLHSPSVQRVIPGVTHTPVPSEPPAFRSIPSVEPGELPRPGLYLPTINVLHGLSEEVAQIVLRNLLRPVRPDAPFDVHIKYANLVHFFDRFVPAAPMAAATAP